MEKIFIPLNEQTKEVAIEIDGELYIQFFTDNDADRVNVPIGKEVEVPSWVVKAAEFGGLI